MTIPLKKCRKIIIDGEKYYWLLKNKRHRILGWSPSSMWLTIQKDGSNGILQCWVRSKRLPKEYDEYGGMEWAYPTHKAALLPSDIEKIIRYGINIGWDINKRIILESGPELNDHYI